MLLLYYLDLFLAQQQNQAKDIQQFTSKVREITIKAPVVVKLHKRMFNLDDDLEEEKDNEQK